MNNSIIQQWDEAVDKSSASKALAFKYFGGDQEQLLKYITSEIGNF